MALMEEAEQALADLIGDEAAFILVEQFGGARLPVPMNASKSRLPALIGAEAAAKLAEAHGGVEIKIPLAKAWRARVYRERGMTYAQIATKLCMSDTTVWEYLRAGGQTGQSAGRQAGAA